jgi:hypothetical protein
MMRESITSEAGCKPMTTEHATDVETLTSHRAAAAATGRQNALFPVTPTSTLPELRQQFPSGEYWDGLLKGLDPTRIFFAIVRIEELVSESLPLRETMLSVMRGIARIQRNAKPVEVRAAR